jgi:hypothetical protein
MSLVVTCKQHGIDPFVYFRDVLERVATHPASKVAGLLPVRWKAAGYAEHTSATPTATSDLSTSAEEPASQATSAPRAE